MCYVIFCIAPQYKQIMDEKFFITYRKTVLKDDEILVSLLIPWTQEVVASCITLHYNNVIYSMSMCTVTNNHFVVTMTLP